MTIRLQRPTLKQGSCLGFGTRLPGHLARAHADDADARYLHRPEGPGLDGFGGGLELDDHQGKGPTLLCEVRDEFGVALEPAPCGRRGALAVEVAAVFKRPDLDDG